MMDYFQRLMCLLIFIVIPMILLKDSSNGIQLISQLNSHPIGIIMIIFIWIGSFGVALNIEKLKLGMVLFQLLITILIILQFIFEIFNRIFGTSYNAVNWF